MKIKIFHVNEKADYINNLLRNLEMTDINISTSVSNYYSSSNLYDCYVTELDMDAHTFENIVRKYTKENHLSIVWEFDNKIFISYPGKMVADEKPLSVGTVIQYIETNPIQVALPI